MIDLMKIAAEAHRDVCPMVNCVDCLFGMCNPDCEYQKQFKIKLNDLIELYERNDNK